MRSKYVIELITAHTAKNEKRFSELVNELYLTEKNKGNSTLSKKILEAYNRPKEIINSTAEENKNTSLSPSSGLVMFEPNKLIPPKEKNNNFDLFELIYPDDISLPDIVLSKQVNQKIEEFIREYHHKETLKELGMPFENRILLCGPPGCGKTSISFLLSEKLNIPIAYVRLDSLISSLLGQTGTNIRKIFEVASGSKLILFLDEFDAIAKKRDDKHELGELKRVVNTLLQNIDMLSDEVILVAATNHPDLLDPAVWRRFNSTILIDLPDNEMRRLYFENRIKEFTFKYEVDWEKIVRVTKGMNFTELNEIILKTVKRIVMYKENKVVETIDLLDTIKNILFLFNEKSIKVELEVSKRLKSAGLTYREIAEITNIPKSTIAGWLKEEERDEK